jgi:hypothetical protein
MRKSLSEGVDAAPGSWRRLGRKLQKEMKRVSGFGDFSCQHARDVNKLS